MRIARRFFVVSIIAAIPINQALSQNYDLRKGVSSNPIRGFVSKPTVETTDPSPFDTTTAKYLTGVGYVFSYRPHAGLTQFRISLDKAIVSRTGRASVLLSKDPADAKIALESALLIFRDEVVRATRERGGRVRTTAANEVIFTGVPTPGAVTSALISIELMLDDLLNRVNSGVSSALFAMRSHVAASIADLNVLFRNRMNETFDRLSAQEQRLLTQAHVLASQAQETVRQLEETGFEHAADLVCQTTAGFANYNVGLPLRRFLRPDLLCLKELTVRDAGPQHEQLLTFRGVLLMPKEEYASARITVGGQVITTTTGGGDSVLQMPLPGGINGAPNDTSLRGDRIAQAEFFWPGANITRRWLFTLKPYLVRSLDASMVPTIKGPVRRDKVQTCYVSARGGSLGSREEYATCTIIADDGWEIENCMESGPTTANGNAGIRNRLFSPGACSWEMTAASRGRFGAGASYGFEGRARMKQTVRIAGKPFDERQIVNQNQTSAVFTYPVTLVPPEYEILQGDWKWKLHYTDNTGRTHTMTDTQPSEAGIGIGALGSGVLTYTALQ